MARTLAVSEAGEQFVEAVVDAIVEGKLTCPKDVEKFADKLSVTEGWVLNVMRHAKTAKSTLERVQIKAAYMVAGLLPVMEAKARAGNIQAFRALCQISTVIPVGGVSFQQNVLVDQRQAGQSDATKAFAMNFWKRLKESRETGVPIVEADFQLIEGDGPAAS